MNQKDATVSALLAVLKARDIEYELGGDTLISEVLNDADKKTVRDTLFDGFREGDISYKPEFQWKVDDEKELKKYVSGLVNNWIRKYKPFNRGEAYVAKNPGSRAHVKDESLQELKKLSAHCTHDPEAMKEIADAIVLRKKQLELEKVKTLAIKIDAIPEHLQHLIKS